MLTARRGDTAMSKLFTTGTLQLGESAEVVLRVRKGSETG